LARILRKLVPDGVQECSATVAGKRMRYLTGGSGPPLLLMHGLMGYSFSWSENLPELAKHFRVIAPDFLNLGYSERCEVGTSLVEVASTMFRFMDVLGLERVAMVGTSHGGGVAMQMAADHPERIQRLLLVAAANPFSERSRWQITLFSHRLGRHLAPLVALTPRSLFALAILLRMYADRNKALPGTVAGYWRPHRWDFKTNRHLARVVVSWTRDFQAIEPRLAEIANNVPTTLLWGAKDLIVSVHSARQLQTAMNNAALIVLENVGHLPYEEAPEEFNSAVITWMNDNLPST
jgi:pimeloyl-ACP methyl ester carboxylesterase